MTKRNKKNKRGKEKMNMAPVVAYLSNTLQQTQSALDTKQAEGQSGVTSYNSQIQSVREDYERRVTVLQQEGNAKIEEVEAAGRAYIERVQAELLYLKTKLDVVSDLLNSLVPAEPNQ